MSHRANHAGEVSTHTEGEINTTKRAAYPRLAATSRKVLRLAMRFRDEGFTPADLQLRTIEVEAVARLESDGLLERIRTVTGVRYWVTERGIEQADRLANGPA
ncbi:hypothetical protein [Zavarzinella formosa]|uniref:hypothetical protein n=1 Tax=Zavarzinella formosa TaxID=360055 RepID=UPI00031C2809|nr:hypothetical protein [Zavarzinella formosa]